MPQDRDVRRLLMEHPRKLDRFVSTKPVPVSISTSSLGTKVINVQISLQSLSSTIYMGSNILFILFIHVYKLQKQTYCFWNHPPELDFPTRTQAPILKIPVTNEQVQSISLVHVNSYKPSWLVFCLITCHG